MLDCCSTLFPCCACARARASPFNNKRLPIYSWSVLYIYHQCHFYISAGVMGSEFFLLFNYLDLITFSIISGLSAVDRIRKWILWARERHIFNRLFLKREKERAVISTEESDKRALG